MKILVPDIYQDFKCIGGDCLKTCCQGWNIVVDSDTIQKYKDSNDPTCKKILDNLVPIENSNDMKIKLTSEELCPFLNETGLCSLVLSKGDDYLGYVCQTYPRIIIRYLDTVFGTVCPSCPEVARMIMDKEDFISFSFDESPDEENYENVDWTLYDELINALVITTNIIQRLDLPLSVRYKILLDISTMIDEHIVKNTISCIRTDIEAFKDFEYLSSYSKNYTQSDYIPIEIVSVDAIQSLPVPQFIKDYFASHNINAYRSDIINSAYSFSKNDKALEYTNLSTAFIFEFFMDVIKGVSLKKNICKMITLMALIQQLHLIDFSQNQSLSKNDSIVGTSMACSLLKHSTILDTIADTMTGSNPSVEMSTLINSII